MDAIVQQAVEHSLLQAASEVESQLDSQLQALENLDEDGIERLRQHRISQLKAAASRRQEWLVRGHGEYREINDEKEFFTEVKGEERVVCHFFRENWPCKVMDKHLAILARSHIETKFIKIQAEKSPFLTERLRVWMLPTLALVKLGKTVDYVVGFADLGGSDDFPTSALAARLAAAGLLTEVSDEYGSSNRRRPGGAAPAAQRAVRHGGRRGDGRRADSDEDSDFD